MLNDSVPSITQLKDILEQVLGTKEERQQLFATFKLEDDFFPPKRIEALLMVNYSKNEKQHFSDSLPNKDALNYYKDKYLMIAGPPKRCLFDTNTIDILINILKKNILISVRYMEYLCSIKDAGIACNKWIAIRKQINSEEMRLNEHLPSISEMLWVFTILNKNAPLSSNSNIYIKTSSIDYVSINSNLSIRETYESDSNLYILK